MHRRRSRPGTALDAELKAIVAHACAVEANFALAEMERLNTEALAALTGQHHVQLRAFPQDLIAAARGISGDVLGDLGGRSAARAQGARFLRCVPRTHRRLVAHFDQGRARRARKLDKPGISDGR